MQTNLDDRLDINDIVAHNLNFFIKARRLRVGEVARQIGITRQTLYDMLRGNCRVSLEKLERFAQVLEVDIQDLLLTPEPTRKEKNTRE